MRSSEGFRNLKKQYEDFKSQSLREKETINPLKGEMEKCKRENNELHTEMIKLKEELDLKDTKWRTTFRSCEDQISDLRFNLETKEREISKQKTENGN